MSFELYRNEGENFRSIRVRIGETELVVDTQDMGPLVKEMWGDSDYEFWTTVEKEHWGALAVALIREFLSGDASATDRLRDICKEHGVPHTWDRWV
jgi:hypothetical protein